MWTTGLALVAALLLLDLSCKRESDPIDVPFTGVDPTVAPHDDPAEPEPTASATSTGQARSSPPGVTGKAAPAGNITGCCAALSAAVKSADDQGERAMYGQAAAVCYRKSQDVEQGKLERGAALAQVRSSLLGAAPPACR